MTEAAVDLDADVIVGHLLRECAVHGCPRDRLPGSRYCWLHEYPELVQVGRGPMAHKPPAGVRFSPPGPQG